MLYLVASMTMLVLAGAWMLGHLGWLGRLCLGLWHRVHPPAPVADNVSIETLVADLRRLADGLEAAHRQDQPAKMARLTAASLAYDWVLLSAARTLDVPVPASAPLDALTRLETEAALAAQGLDW